MSMGASMARLAGAMAGSSGGVRELADAVNRLSTSVIDASRHYTAYSPVGMQTRMIEQIGNLARSIRISQATAGTTQQRVVAEQRLRNAFEPIQARVINIVNQLATRATSFATGILDRINKEFGLGEAEKESYLGNMLLQDLFGMAGIVVPRMKPPPKTERELADEAAGGRMAGQAIGRGRAVVNAVPDVIKKFNEAVQWVAEPFVNIFRRVGGGGGARHVVLPPGLMGAGAVGLSPVARRIAKARARKHVREDEAFRRLGLHGRAAVQAADRRKRLAEAMRAGPIGRVIPPGYKTSAERLRERMIRDQGLVKRGEVLMQKAGVLPGMFSPQLRKELAMQVARDASRPDLLQVAKATEERRNTQAEIERREATIRGHVFNRGPLINKARTQALTKPEKVQRDILTGRIEELQKEIDKLKGTQNKNHAEMASNGLKVNINDRGWVTLPLAVLRPL